MEIALTVNNGQPIATIVANESRPDLVPKQAPNPNHGFAFRIPRDDLPVTGKHFVDAWIVNIPECETPCPLNGSPRCVCDGKPCVC